MKTLFRKDLALWWRTSTTYVCGSALLITCGYFFFTYANSYQQQVEQYRAGFLAEGSLPSMRHIIVEPYLETVGFLLVALVPLFFLRVQNEERGRRLSSFLYALPLSTSGLVLGRFFAALLTLSTLMFLVVVPIFTLLVLTDLSLFIGLVGFIGLVLVSALYLAIGFVGVHLFGSPISLTLVHATLLFGIYFLPALGYQLGGEAGDVIAGLSPVTYTEEMFRGYLSLSQILFFLVGIIAFLGVSGFLTHESRERA
jgi:ABC-2 type transport system permease protein